MLFFENGQKIQKIRDSVQLFGPVFVCLGDETITTWKRIESFVVLRKEFNYFLKNNKRTITPNSGRDPIRVCENVSDYQLGL